PKDTQARLNLANMYSEANRIAEAQELYDVILHEGPGNAGALLGHGVILRKKRLYREALDEYLKAAEIEPKSPAVLYNIALIYDFYLPDSDKAREYYEKYIAAGGSPDRLPEAAP